MNLRGISKKSQKERGISKKSQKERGILVKIRQKVKITQKNAQPGVKITVSRQSLLNHHSSKTSDTETRKARSEREPGVARHRSRRVVAAVVIPREIRHSPGGLATNNTVGMPRNSARCSGARLDGGDAAEREVDISGGGGSAASGFSNNKNIPWFRMSEVSERYWVEVKKKKKVEKGKVNKKVLKETNNIPKQEKKERKNLDNLMIKSIAFPEFLMAEEGISDVQVDLVEISPCLGSGSERGESANLDENTIPDDQ